MILVLHGSQCFSANKDGGAGDIQHVLTVCQVLWLRDVHPPNAYGSPHGPTFSQTAEDGAYETLCSIPVNEGSALSQNYAFELGFPPVHFSPNLALKQTLCTLPCS